MGWSQCQPSSRQHSLSPRPSPGPHPHLHPDQASSQAPRGILRVNTSPTQVCASFPALQATGPAPQRAWEATLNHSSGKGTLEGSGSFLFDLSSAR